MWSVSQDQLKAETVSLLQDLGLKEYEARCFLVLTQLPAATAKEISNLSEVPRTRVYDAVRSLDAQGLVEIQHSTPQQFRATSVTEGAATLRQHYDDRIDSLQSNLESLSLKTESNDPDRLQEVWSLSSTEGIQSRMFDLLENAESEIMLLIVEEDLLTEALFDRLHDAVDRDVSVVIGGKTDAITARLETELPSVQVFKTDLSWLMGSKQANEVAISRILLVDRTALLVSSFYPHDGHEAPHEQAVFANGLENGIVVLVRRLISSGLLPSATPGG